MKKEFEWLYKRADAANTETPRECQILSLDYADKGLPIPAYIAEALLSSTERGREKMERVIETINLSAQNGVGKETAGINAAVLAATIAANQGIDGPLAAKRRHNNLLKYFASYRLMQEIGPTE